MARRHESLCLKMRLCFAHGTSARGWLLSSQKSNDAVFAPMVARGMEAAGVAAYRRRRDELAALNAHQRSAASRAYQLRRAKQRQGASRSGGVPAREAAARARARAAVAKQDTQ